MITGHPINPGVIHLHRRITGKSVAHDDPVASRAGNPPHGRAHRIGRGHPPARFAAKAVRFLRAQGPGHGTIGKHVQQPPFEMPETVGMAVDAQHHFGCRNRAAWCFSHPHAVANQRSDGGVFVDTHPVGRQPRRHTPHKERRLDHCGARGVEPAFIVIGAGHGPHRVGIKHFAGFAQSRQMRRVVAIVLGAFGRRRSVDLARARKAFLAQTKLGSHVCREIDACTVERDLHAIAIRLAPIIARRQIMGQVDHEAGVPPGRPLRHAAGLQQNNPRLGIELGQPPRRGKPCKSRTDHQKVRRDALFQYLRRPGGRKDVVPGRRARILGKAGHFHGRLNWAMRPPSMV